MAEPVYDRVMPPMPSAVANDAVAKGEWERLAPALVENGLLNEASVAVFGTICCLYSLQQACAAEIEEQGRFVEVPIVSKMTGEQVGTIRKPNPAIKIQLDAGKELRANAVEFGMTPAAKTKVKTVSKSGSEQPTGLQALLRMPGLTSGQKAN